MPFMPHDHVPLGYTLLTPERVAELIGRPFDPAERLGYMALRPIWDAYGTSNVKEIEGKGVAVNTGRRYDAISEASFLGDATGKNTRIEVMYRDASNYKERFNYVFEGALTLDEAKALIDSLDANDNFLPPLVGLGEAEWSENGTGAHYGDDHPYHEIDGVELTTDDSDADDTASEIVARFVAIGPDGWIVPKKKRKSRAKSAA